MTTDLNGKVAAVTGATSGIGEATALALAEAGAAVALAGRRADRLNSLAERIESAGGKALPLPTDVSDEQQANAFVKGTHEQLGGLDILVNNAGVMLRIRVSIIEPGMVETELLDHNTTPMVIEAAKKMCGASATG